MTRFRLLLVNEFKLSRTALPIHLVVLLQPTVMYLLMSVILVHPTFDMYVIQPNSPEGGDLVAAMGQVGSPIGVPYINPIAPERNAAESVRRTEEEGAGHRQVIRVETRDGVPTAVQRYGLIDSNIVKNFRNRLTAAALRVWDEELGPRAVSVEEHPWLPRDVPYMVYFGMAMLPMTAFLVASVLGAVLTAQEFEQRTILEYRLASAPVSLVLGARLTRLLITAYLAAWILLVAVGFRAGAWPDSLWRVALILLPVSLMAGGIGIVAGLLLRKTIPAFLVGLVGSFVCWLLGSAFGLAAGFSRGYEMVSRLTPNTHAVELLFPSYYGIGIGAPLVSVLALLFFGGAMLVLTSLVYRWQVVRQESS
jgi:ABC-type multidrug transport system permease subunit